MVSPVTALREDLRRRLATYVAARNATANPVRPGDIVWLTPIHVAEDGVRAREEARPSLEAYFRVVAEASSAGFLKAGGDPANLPPVVKRLRDATYDDILGDMAIVGSPAEVRDRVSELEYDYGVGHVQTWFNAGGLIPNELVQRSMRLFINAVRS